MAVWFDIEDLTLSITTRIGRIGPRTLLAQYKPNNNTPQISENNEEEQTPMFSSAQLDNEPEDETHNQSRLFKWNVIEEFKRANFDLKMEGNQKKIAQAARTVIITGDTLKMIENTVDFKDKLINKIKHAGLIQEINRRNPYTYSIQTNNPQEAEKMVNENYNLLTDKTDWKICLLIYQKHME